MIEIGSLLPVESVPAGTSLLVTGPPEVRKRTLATIMLAEGYPREDGLVYISPDDSSSTVVEEVEAVLGTTVGDQLAVIECIRPAHRRSPSTATTTVSSPGDLTGMAMAFSQQRNRLTRDGYAPPRVALHSLSPLLSESNMKAVQRFLHVITGTIDEQAGFCVVTIDTPATEEPVDRLRPVFSGVVETRPTEADLELRVTGLPNVSEEWIDVSVESSGDLRQS